MVEMIAVTTSPVGSAVEPERPAIGASARRTHGEPRNRTRASAKRDTASVPPWSGAATVTRSCWMRRRLGAPITASGTRSGTR